MRLHTATDAIIRRIRAVRTRFQPLPPLAEAERQRDRAGLPAQDPGIDQAVDEAIRWLGRAQDCSASRDDGVARHFSLLTEWSTSYPETTGYIVPTLLAYATLRDVPSVRTRAKQMLDWLVSIQRPDGGFQGSVIGATPLVSVTFNTGQVLLGLAAGVREFSEYRDPMCRAADWLVATQDSDGCWRRYRSPFATSDDKAYDTHVAWGLLEAARLEPDAPYAKAALANVEWALTRQHANGWFEHCCLDQPERPLTHTIGYALRGILEAYRFTKDSRLLTASQRTADGLLRTVKSDGFLPGRLDREWHGTVDWACLTGSAQIALCWLMLYEETGHAPYRDVALLVNQFVRRTMRLDGPNEIRGAIKGSFPVWGGYAPYEFPNWAAKFLIDSCLLERTVRRHSGYAINASDPALVSAPQATHAARRVLMVAYHFPPSSEMGAQVCGQIARYLPEYGWEPVVLTIDERYLPDRDPSTRPAFPVTICRTGALPHPLGLYRWACSLRRRNGAAPAGPLGALTSRQSSRLKRWVLSLLLIPDELTGWLPIALARGWALVRRERIAQLWSSGPSWTNHLVALGLKRLTGLPWTAHFRDPWAQFKLDNAGSPESQFSLAIARRLERLVVRHADAVVCVTARHTDAMRRLYHALPPLKFTTISNGYSPEEFEGLADDGPDPTRDHPAQFAITYTGSLYIWRDLTPILTALRALIDEGEIRPDEVVLNLVGRCELAQGRPVREIARELGLESVLRLPGTVSRRQALRYMVHSDLLLLLAEQLTLQVPGKTYEYLRAGRPVLALTADGATADLIRQTGAGEIVAPHDVPAITKYLRHLVGLHRSGQRPGGPDPMVVRNFDRRLLTRRFAAVFSELAGKRTP